ncbi:MAG TPA: hypothetical protein VGX48_10545 [Pyrinomonadaceae bacterium]|jgi:hypothetical protein|nr:hypothetical protein [Pyrinomonadaceae bacterium]
MWDENAWWGENHKLREAVLALRMVAVSADECYEDVAARVDREAGVHTLFRQNPCAIGKISLNTKLIPPDKGGGRFVTELYQVRDPAEGRAYVFYTFPRSDRLVLEFFVHDEKGEPLFPLVRTYSNWTGTRKFDLGLGRTFTLRMTEGESPDVVRVQAGFASPQVNEVEWYDAEADSRGLPLAPCAAGAGPSDSSNTYRQRHERKLSFMNWAVAIGMVVAGIFCWTLFRNFAGRPHQGPPADRSLDAALYPTTVEFVTFGNGDARLGATKTRSTLWKAKETQAALRDVGVSGSSPAVVNALGREASGRCDELVANLRKAVGDMLHFVALHADGPGGRGATRAAGAASEKLAEVYFGRVSVTFYTQNGLLKVKDAGCLGSEEGEGGFTVITPAVFPGQWTKALYDGTEAPGQETTEGEEPLEQAMKLLLNE